MRLDIHILVVATAMVVVAVFAGLGMRRIDGAFDILAPMLALVFLAIVAAMAMARAFDIWRTCRREAVLYLGQNVGLGACVAALLWM